MYWFLVADFILLGWIGQKPVETPYIEIGFFATYFYFIFLSFIVVILGIVEEGFFNNEYRYFISKTQTKKN
jgi:quinol-cytochrome oxidoreductase complex cytochrome b subunit